MPHKDSLANTLIVAVALCLVCSAVVSIAAVGLKPIKNRNVLLDRRANILKVTGFSDKDIKAAGGINELFEKRFDTTIIDLSTGAVAIDECKAALIEAGKEIPADSDVVSVFDQFWASKSKKPAVSEKLEKTEDIVGIKYLEKFSHVFMLKDESGKVTRYVFPVRSYGLWSMMQGYLAVEPDFQTVAGLTFYEQAETPGLGGEIMNPEWKKKWQGKKIYENDAVALEVTKTAQPGDEHTVDALSGATITSNGVSNLVEFWMGPKGFGPFIEKTKAAGAAGATNGQ